MAPCTSTPTVPSPAQTATTTASTPSRTSPQTEPCWLSPATVPTRRSPRTGALTLDRAGCQSPDQQWLQKQKQDRHGDDRDDSHCHQAVPIHGVLADERCRT